MNRFILISAAFSFLTLMSCSIENGDENNNLGFESNSFENWTTIGNASIQNKDFGVVPAEGNFNALITTHAAAITSTSNDPVITDELALFSQLTIDEINVLNSEASLVTEGSAIKANLNANSGDNISIKWNFLTEETAGGEGGTNDYAFFILESPGVLVQYTASVFIESDALVFPSETGYKETTLNVQGSGEHTLIIGITNVLDTRFGSGLLIDDIRIIKN